MSTKLNLMVNSIFLATLLSVSHALLKWVARKQVSGYGELLTVYWFQVGLALFIYGFIFFYYIQVLRQHDIAKLYSIYTGLSILLVLLTGTLFFEETLSMRQIAGCVLIIMGVLFIGA